MTRMMDFFTAELILNFPHRNSQSFRGHWPTSHPLWKPFSNLSNQDPWEEMHLTRWPGTPSTCKCLQETNVN